MGVALVCAGCAHGEIATASAPAPISSQSALGAVGLPALSWRMRQGEVRAAYPFIGNAAIHHPTVPWDWNEFTTHYGLGGCQFVLRFLGTEDDPKFTHTFSSLLGVTLTYLSGPRETCRNAIGHAISGYLRTKPLGGGFDRPLYAANSGKLSFRHEDDWTWFTRDASISVIQQTLEIKVYDTADDSPLIR